MRGQFGKDRVLHRGGVGRRRVRLTLCRALRGRSSFARLRARRWSRAFGRALDQKHVVDGLAERLAAHDHCRRGKAQAAQFLPDGGLGVLRRPNGGRGHEIRIVRGVPVRSELVRPGLDVRMREDAALVLGADEFGDVLRVPDGAVSDTAVDLGETVPVLVGWG